MTQVMVQTEHLAEGYGGEMFSYHRVRLHACPEIGSRPSFGGIRLRNLVRLFAAEAGLDKRKHQVLAKYEFAHLSQVLPHPLRENLQVGEQARYAVDHEVGKVA